MTFCRISYAHDGTRRFPRPGPGLPPRLRFSREKQLLAGKAAAYTRPPVHEKIVARGQKTRKQCANIGSLLQATSRCGKIYYIPIQCHIPVYCYKPRRYRRTSVRESQILRSVLRGFRSDRFHESLKSPAGRVAIEMASK